MEVALNNNHADAAIALAELGSDLTWLKESYKCTTSKLARWNMMLNDRQDANVLVRAIKNAIEYKKASEERLRASLRGDQMQKRS